MIERFPKMIERFPKLYLQLKVFLKLLRDWAGNVVSSIAAPIARMKYIGREPVWGDLSREEQAKVGWNDLAREQQAKVGWKDLSLKEQHRLSWDDFPNQHKVGLQDLTRREDRNLLRKLLNQHILLVEQFGGQAEMVIDGTDKPHKILSSTLDYSDQFDAITVSITIDDTEIFRRGDKVVVAYPGFGSDMLYPKHGDSESCRDRHNWFPLEFMSFSGEVLSVRTSRNCLIIIVYEIYTRAGIEIQKEEHSESAMERIATFARLPETPRNQAS